MKKLVSLSLLSLLALGASLRQELGEVNMVEHLNGEVRVGYIMHDFTKDKDLKAFGLGGHLHIDTASWHGFKVNATFDALGNLGFVHSDPDFYGEKNGVAMVSEANIEYKNNGFDLKVGRFMIDTPHADSDDIRMIPNYFQGAALHYKSDYGLLHLAHISKMAGWESGGDIAKFKPLYEVVGSSLKSDGLNLIGFESDYGSIWAYNIDEIANVLYVESGFEAFGVRIDLQADIAKDTGSRIAGEIDSKLFGVSVGKEFDQWSVNAAYNQEFGDTAPMFSFGGGPFFTSMEELTIDAVGAKNALSYVAGVQRSFGEHSFGVMVGRFKGEGFKSDEVDIYGTISLAKSMNVDLMVARIDDHYGEDFGIYRAILKIGF